MADGYNDNNGCAADNNIPDTGKWQSGIKEIINKLKYCDEKYKHNGGKTNE